MWLIYFAVQQKLTQQRKATTLQEKKRKNCTQFRSTNILSTCVF